MIYRKLIVTVQSYEVSCQDIILFQALLGLAALLRVDTEKMNILEKIGG